jgi:hypothetical protein
MRASRRAKLNFMRGAETLNLEDYPMSHALVDMVDYYNVGTIVGAFESIVAEAGQKERTAAAAIEKRVEDKIQFQYTPGPLRDQIEAWLLKDPKKNVAELEKWLKIRNVKNISAAGWVRDPRTTDADLQDAVRELQIPQIPKKGETHEKNKN